MRQHKLSNDEKIIYIQMIAVNRRLVFGTDAFMWAERNGLRSFVFRLNLNGVKKPRFALASVAKRREFTNGNDNERVTSLSEFIGPASS